MTSRATITACICLLVGAVAAADVDWLIDNEASFYVGIDLGVATARMGVYVNGTFTLVANDQGDYSTPFCVGFTDGGEMLVGNLAEKLSLSFPQHVVCGAHLQLLTSSMSDDDDEDEQGDDMHRDLPDVPFPLVRLTGKRLAVRVPAPGNNTQVVSFEALYAALLARLKADAEAHLGQPVHHVALAVPAELHSHYLWSKALREGTKSAGLHVGRYWEAPLAAVAAHQLHKRLDDRAVVVVVDMADDALRITANKVVKNEGFMHGKETSPAGPGGSTYDTRIAEHWAKAIEREHGMDISEDASVLAVLRHQAGHAKRALCEQEHVDVFLKSVVAGEVFNVTLTAAQFEDLTEDLLNATVEQVQQMFDARFKRERVAALVLVGASACMPRLQQLLTNFLGGMKPEAGIHPEEVVAYGVALMEDPSVGHVSDFICIFPYLSLPLGVETGSSVMSTIAPRGSVTPHKTKVFTTHRDNQSSVSIKVFEGMSSQSQHNAQWAQLDLVGIPPAPAGETQIEVTFQVDEDDYLEVTALVRGTDVRGYLESIRIGGGQGRLEYVECLEAVCSGQLDASWAGKACLSNEWDTCKAMWTPPPGVTWGGKAGEQGDEDLGRLELYRPRVPEEEYIDTGQLTEEEELMEED